MFKVSQIDHIHINVPDKYEAAEWYERAFGLEIVEDKEYWAEGNGPLIVSSDNGNTSLALFSRTGSFSEVAFRVSAEGFVEFLDHAGEIGLLTQRGYPVAQDQVVDHDGAYSVYVSDPWGNLMEVTCYECDSLKALPGFEA